MIQEPFPRTSLPYRPPERANGQTGELSMSKYLLGSLLLLSLVLCALAVPSGQTRAAPETGPEDPRVTANPAAVSYGQSITITIEGLPEGYPLGPGAVTLGGVRLPMPGYFRVKGEKPRSDAQGSISYTVTLPLGIPLGSQPLVVDCWQPAQMGQFWAREIRGVEELG